MANKHILIFTFNCSQIAYECVFVWANGNMETTNDIMATWIAILANGPSLFYLIWTPSHDRCTQCNKNPSTSIYMWRRFIVIFNGAPTPEAHYGLILALVADKSFEIKLKMIMIIRLVDHFMVCLERARNLLNGIFSMHYGFTYEYWIRFRFP